MNQKSDIRIHNNLHTKEECPNCHFVFVGGYDTNNTRQCPSCNTQFISGQKPSHKNCSTCANKYPGSNNVYYKDGCPAIMADGRFLTYYNSTNELTENMRKINGFTNSNEFRQFMQKHADKFMDAERNHLLTENTCCPNIACSQGWYDLWDKNGGSWAKKSTVAPFNS